MELAALMILGAFAAAYGSSAEALIRNVSVRGTLRMRPEAVVGQMSSLPGTRLDPARVSDDIRRLHRLGVFSSIQIRSATAVQGQVDLLVDVRERPLVSSFCIEGVDEGLESRIRAQLKEQGLEFQFAVPYDPAKAVHAARAARAFLADRGYPLADVRILTEDRGSLIGIQLGIRPGPRLKVGRIAFFGNRSLPTASLLGRVRDTRPPRWWERWSGIGYYRPEALSADLDRVRQYYRSQGYADVWLGAPKTVVSETSPPWWLPSKFAGKRQKILIDIPVAEGNRCTLRSVNVVGDAGSAAGSIRSIASRLREASRYDASLLEAARKEMLDALGRHGYASGRVELDETIDSGHRSVRATYRVDAGRPVLIGRIRFEGNLRLPDRLLRRELRVAEGEVFDSARLTESIERLNGSGLVEPVRREDVEVQLKGDASEADILFKLREKRARAIYGTGGTGGATGGYLGILYTAVNLLGLGERLTLELDGGASQSNLLLDLAGRHFLGMPFSFGLSVFHRFSGVNVAGIVPDATDLVSVFRERRTGLQLTARYSLTRKLQAGAGLLAEHRSVATAGTTDAQADARDHIGSELSSTILLDSRTGLGQETEGFRLMLGNTMSHLSFLRSPEAVGSSANFSGYLADPLSSNRHSFAFVLRLSGVRPLGGRQLAPDRRMYVGGEVLRGFSRGGLGSWAFSAANDAPAPAGSDTLVAGSCEYRVPISGPLSGTAFFDIGWTRLDPANESAEERTRLLLEATNGLARASVGGEFRLDLPVIRQPGRLIFAWNPLRLDRLLSAGGSTHRLADPRGMVRFALGGVY